MDIIINVISSVIGGLLLQNKVLLLLVAVISIPGFLIFNLFKKKKSELEETKSELEETKSELEELREKYCVEDDNLPGRYFIGIDVGRNTIDCCVINHGKFNEKNDGREELYDGKKSITYDTGPMGNICVKLADVIDEIYKLVNFQIDGVGIGLPGQVDPIRKIFVYHPSPEEPVQQLCIDRDIKNKLKYVKNDIKIKIDNDARCATRYFWKKEKEKDLICLLVGKGLGSGIVSNNEMIYGSTFMAGEIGHTSVSQFFLESEDIHKSENYTHCGCLRKSFICDGCHLEMYASDYGMINIAKNLVKEYEDIKKDYKNIIEGDNFRELLRTEEFKVYYDKDKKIDRLFDEKNKELTTYFFSLAFHAGESYAINVVKEFIKYLGIGTLNYLSIINPQRIYLAGGMIDGFISVGESTPFDIRRELHEVWQCYGMRTLIRHLSIPDIRQEKQKRRLAASIGAALIFKDASYFKYIQDKNEK